MHAADLYVETRERVISIARSLDPDLEVPACPGWTVREVIAHVTGLASDVVNAQLDGYASPVWTARQIDDRSGRSISDLVEEWDSVLASFVEVNRDLAGSALPDKINHVLGPMPKTAFEAAFHVDLLHHEHDLLGAAGTPRVVALRADLMVFKAQLANVRLRFALDEMPTLRVAPTSADRTWDIGSEEPVARLSASPVELLRSFGGRRSLDQIRQLDWSGDASGMAERLVLPFFQAPSEAIAGG